MEGAFSPDGRRIVTAGEEYTPRLWDAESGNPIGDPLRGHERSVWSAAFSIDGRRIVTGSFDATVRLWDAGTGKPIREPLKGHAEIVRGVAFGPDGHQIVTASMDTTARLWSIFADTQEMVSHAKAIVPRCLTPAQRSAFFLPLEPPHWCIELAKWPYDMTALKH